MAVRQLGYKLQRKELVPNFFNGPSREWYFLRLYLAEPIEDVDWLFEDSITALGVVEEHQLIRLRRWDYPRFNYLTYGRSLSSGSRTREVEDVKLEYNQGANMLQIGTYLRALAPAIQELAEKVEADVER